MLYIVEYVSFEALFFSKQTRVMRFDHWTKLYLQFLVSWSIWTQCC